ncbi:helix-turn-helix transcriptional regulator [Yoonia vestfoldensis]|jgi:DNA-binding NarL/FixJ family response regulator|uniref:HTH luxR-type domain-containing protein n=1 Tax=Yoonia vestfoldensis SKA53 TaxID=314232 RepID=A3V7W1_9RHOB|nr:hypothetical protein [Yoonia vestfoldensis]EAQ05761.1 hypothetical protein SKA53_06642 [Yoonia vestfoldensis SKA53]
MVIKKSRAVEQTTMAWRRKLFVLAAALQTGCGIIFAIDVFNERTEFTTQTLLELVAVIALSIGATLSISQYRALLRRNSKVQRELDAASGAFQDVIEQYFKMWGLTEAECDVALLSIKGVSIADIAVMRNTRQGTIKAQNSAIYRKAGISSRAELLAVMVEELIEGLEVKSPITSH